MLSTIVDETILTLQKAGLLALLEPTTSHARKLLNAQFEDRIALIWTATDVHNLINTYGRALTRDQAYLVLEFIEREHDASRGVCWETLTAATHELFDTNTLPKLSAEEQAACECGHYVIVQPRTRKKRII